jgi:hypothetical protein
VPPTSAEDLITRLRHYRFSYITEHIKLRDGDVPEKVGNTVSSQSYVRKGDEVALGNYVVVIAVVGPLLGVCNDPSRCVAD